MSRLVSILILRPWFIEGSILGLDYKPPRRPFIPPFLHLRVSGIVAVFLPCLSDPSCSTVYTRPDIYIYTSPPARSLEYFVTVAKLR